jgi:hypothetical protein
MGDAYLAKELIHQWLKGMLHTCISTVAMGGASKEWTR